jgi:nucleoside-diphosphate-sugar epimerase
MSETLKEEFHVVLGASGVIGSGVVDELTKIGVGSVGVARTPKVGWRQADLVDSAQTLVACEGASHIYLCAGLKYDTAVWRREWPQIMDNVIAASITTGAKIVFLDNIYLYGPPPLREPITEDHPQEPVSNKGKVRLEIADKLLKAHKDGKVKALIARAPDFYGPNCKNSVLYPTVLANMLQGKSAQWLGDPRLVHTFGFTSDISKSMVVLARDPKAYGQVWHTPTSSQPVTAVELHSKIKNILGVKLKLVAMPSFLVKVLKLFVPILGELDDVGYQYYNPYVFSSRKFEIAYADFKITSYDDGLTQMISSLQ